MAEAVDYSCILKELQGDGWVNFLGSGGVGGLIMGGLGIPDGKNLLDFRSPEVDTCANCFWCCHLLLSEDPT